MSEDDIRNVIYLDEISENTEEEREEKEERKSIFLSESDLKNKLDGYRGRIPSVILKDLYEVLKGRKITEEQLKKIIASVENRLKAREEVDISELYAKIDRLEKALQKLLRMQLRQAIAAPPEKPEAEEVGEEPQAEVEEKTKSERVKDVEAEKKPGDNGIFMPQAVQIGNALKKGESKIFLDKIPKNTSSMMFLLRWIEHLIERVGYSGLEDVLDYYVDIGWISEDVMFEILRHAKGIKLYHENADWRPAGFMSVHDHLMSLMFIEALKTGRMNKEILHEVERQVYRIKKGVSEINGI